MAVCLLELAHWNVYLKRNLIPLPTSVFTGWPSSCDLPRERSRRILDFFGVEREIEIVTIINDKESVLDLCKLHKVWRFCLTSAGLKCPAPLTQLMGQLQVVFQKGMPNTRRETLVDLQMDIRRSVGCASLTNPKVTRFHC